MTMTTSPPTDSVKHLVLRARGGDGQAVAELYTRFWRAARTAAYTVVRDFSTAEDVAAEAFRDALAALGRLRDPERFAPWLRRIVRRKAAVVARAAAAHVTLDQVREVAGGTREALEQRELAALVAQGIDRLPAAEREAILLYYFEGYASADAARFTDVPVGTFRRRLHDGRVRLRKVLLALESATAPPDERASTLRARVARLLSGKASAAQLYMVMRDVVLTRPAPRDLAATLGRRFAPSAVAIETAAARFLVRPTPLLDEAGALGDTARALRSALRDFPEWKVDVPRVMALWFKAPGAAPEMSPPSFATGQPGRYFRITRGLLVSRDDGTVIDMAELLSQSGSLSAFRGGMQQAMLSDVFDVYWIDQRSVALSEVEEWVMALADTVVPGAKKACSLHRGPRYRTALRLDFAGDARPAAIGGVLTSWPGAPDDAQAVHMRIHVEPWAQQRSGTPVATPSMSGVTFPARPVSTDTPSRPPRPSTA